MMLEISHTTECMGGEGNFCDVAPTYVGNATKMAVLLRAKIKSLYWTSRCLGISPNPALIDGILRCFDL